MGAQAGRQASRRASRQAGKQQGRQASKQSKQASKKAGPPGRQASRQAARQASKQACQQAGRPSWKQAKHLAPKIGQAGKQAGKQEVMLGMRGAQVQTEMRKRQEGSQPPLRDFPQGLSPRLSHQRLSTIGAGRRLEIQESEIRDSASGDPVFVRSGWFFWFAWGDFSRNQQKTM